MNQQSLSIYLAGLLQGIALVAFPASSTILTDPGAFHLTSTQYGSLFIPQAIFSILTALLNPMLCRTFGLKKTFLAGLTANFFSMALLTCSAGLIDNHLLAMCLLMCATSCLGLGFGTMVPTINRMVEVLYPQNRALFIASRRISVRREVPDGVAGDEGIAPAIAEEPDAPDGHLAADRKLREDVNKAQNSDSAVLLLNALLGVGTTLAPVFMALFTKIGFWWGLPLFLALTLFALIVWSLRLTLPEERHSEKRLKSPKLSSLAYVFIAFAFLYGIIETLNGNWVSIYMRKHLGASMNLQALALTAFWGMVTVGRVFFSAMSKVLSEQMAFQIAPFISAVAFVIIASLISGQEYVAVIAFGLIGFGCSILLPLLISFGGKELSPFAAAVPGMIISSYLLGYGVAAFGVGPLEEFAHISLRAIYLMGALIACILGLLSIYIIHKGGRA